MTVIGDQEEENTRSQNQRVNSKMRVTGVVKAVGVVVEESITGKTRVGANLTRVNDFPRVVEVKLTQV